jgi:hypothetical protein
VARRDWWFQGRELVEALRVRLAAAAGEGERAAGCFLEAVAHAEAHDHYAAVWLGADCVGALRGTGAGGAGGAVGAVGAALDRLAMHARALGYQPLLERLVGPAKTERAELRVAS